MVWSVSSPDQSRVQPSGAFCLLRTTKKVAVPLVVVVGTATFFVVRNKQKAPLGCTRL